MTDAEIVKALDCCIETSGVNCGKCPYCDNCITDENTSLMMTDTLDLINRQKAEIERLKQIVGFTPARGSGKSPLLNAVLDNVRAEAYREFAKELNNKGMLPHEINDDYAVGLKTIDNCLKRLVGDDDG